ncbi:hypothetical protein AB6D66_18910 [Vibrio pomeroyi]|uniref:Uncharacterized protein n=1 Tax=Vibrio pomeroyi TaxID=198832 RepID=A0ABV4N0W6_9VIBR
MEYVIRKRYIDAQFKTENKQDFIRHSCINDNEWFSNESIKSVRGTALAEEMELLLIGEGADNIRRRSNSTIFDHDVLYLTKRAWELMDSTPALALAFDQLSDTTSGNDFVVQAEALLVAELGGTISDFISLDNQKDKTQQVSV